VNIIKPHHTYLNQIKPHKLDQTKQDQTTFILKQSDFELMIHKSLLLNRFFSLRPRFEFRIFRLFNFKVEFLTTKLFKKKTVSLHTFLLREQHHLLYFENFNFNYGRSIIYFEA
jgi:hypothetical protein